MLCDWDLAEDHSNGDRLAVGVGQSSVTAPPDKGKGRVMSLRRSQRIASKPSNQQNTEHTAVTSETQVKPRFRTGTGPFMAVDLLISNPPPLHKYRHDLESFFYIYVCTAATFDPDRKQRIRVIEAWNSHDLKSIGLLKRQFLANLDEYDELLKQSHVDLKPIVDGPLSKLYDMFSEVENLSAKAQRVRIRNRSEGSEGSDAVRTQVDETHKQRDAVATYESFMGILKEPLY